MRAPITVLLADDQDMIRDALRALLAKEPTVNVVGQARNGFEAVEEARRLKPDVVLMDVRMPGMSGPEATARIRGSRELGGTRVLILSTFEDSEVVRACIKAGADGFIGKSAPTASLVGAIAAVDRGESSLSPRAARALVAELEHPSGSDSPRAKLTSQLTTREADIVTLVALGLSNDEIGRRLSISPATAKTHVRNAMRKLDIHDRAQLVALVHQVGFRG